MIEGKTVLEFLRSLVFPRACIGCDRNGVLMCIDCARGSGAPRTIVAAGVETFSCVSYSGVVREAINAFKHGRRAFAADLAALAIPYLDASITLVPIPTTRKRRAERGFDQTQLIAEILRRTCGVRVEKLLLRGPGAPQQGRSQSERLQASGRFRIRRKAAASDRDFVLFDDVRTTGSTLADASRTLQDAGFRLAGALTIAWTPEEKS